MHLLGWSCPACLDAETAELHPGMFVLRMLRDGRRLDRRADEHRRRCNGAIVIVSVTPDALADEG
jgi:hypothetical protein